MICSGLLHTYLEQKKNALGYEDFYQLYVNVDKLVKERVKELELMPDKELVEFGRKFFDLQLELYGKKEDAGKVACGGTGCSLCCYQKVSTILGEKPVKQLKGGRCERLVRGRCAEYEERPLVCRKHVVVGKPCEAKVDKKANKLILMASEILLSALLRIHVSRYGDVT